MVMFLKIALAMSGMMTEEWMVIEAMFHREMGSRYSGNKENRRACGLY